MWAPRHGVTAWWRLGQRAGRSVHGPPTVVRGAAQHMYQQHLSRAVATVAWHIVRVRAVDVGSIFSKVSAASVVTSLSRLFTCSQ